ncbi:MAG: S8 family serine peptidase [Dehalococcoidia bacterium]|nr:S8 family serine peptidase [Dehalococcoidia bacterium]
MAKQAIRILAALALLVAILAARPGGDPGEPVAEDWVRLQLAGGQEAPASLETQGFRQLPVPEGTTPEAYSAWLESQPGVLNASPDPIVTAAAGPNDFYYRVQRAYLEPLGAAAAWDITTDAQEIVVAVLDTGIDFRHRDLVRNLWQNPNDADNDGVDDDNNGCIDDRYGCRFLTATPTRIEGCGYTSSTPTGHVRDDHGTAERLGSHGTSVAGIIGARGNNQIGITGVAWRVRLMTLKVLDCGVGGKLPSGEMSNVARAIDYARRMGADIINISFASGPGDPNNDTPELRAAIESALADGLIIVAAAGNHGARGVGFPAAYAQYPNVIGVGASDPTNGNAWAPYSSYGGGVDIAAPGGVDPRGSGRQIVSTLRSDLVSPPYGYLPQGTSSAAPIVTGAFALAMARNPGLTMEEYIAIVQESATPPVEADHGGNWAGAGVVDIRGVLERVPMTLSGRVLRDWVRPAPGTAVQALIDGVECGSSETVTVNGTAQYSLRIAGENEIEGCGAPGRDIEIRVGGLPMADPLPWSAPNEVLTLEDFTVNGIEAPPGAVVVQELGEGWSLSAYLGPTTSLPEATAAFPDGWAAIAVWDADAEGGGAFRLYYPGAPDSAQTLTELSEYEAFWIFSEGGIMADLTPEPVPGRQVALAEGWNAVVYTGEARAVANALASINGLYDQVLSYDNVTRLWSSHLPGSAAQLNDFGGLYPFRVYWIRMTAPGTLVMQ